MYRGLTLPGLLVRALQRSDAADDALIADHRAIIAAYDAADLDAARAVIRVHTNRTKAVHRRALQREA